MRASVGWLLGAGVALVTSSCGIATTAGADYDRGVDLSPYHTFAFHDIMDRTSGDSRLEDNPFFEQQLHDAIERELAKRGITRNDDSPDLLVHHHVNVQDHVEVYEREPTAGTAPSEYGPGTDVLQYEQGTFLVHIHTPDNQTLWIGWAQGDVGRALTDPDEMRKWVDDAVAKMFAYFPGS